MTKLQGARNQQIQDPLFFADGAVTTGGAAQLVLPVRFSCSSLILQNTSAGALYFEFGSARGVATISGGKVTSVAVTNAGFGFTYAPEIIFWGGGNGGNSTYLGVGLPGAQAPSHVATAHCVMTGTAPNMSVASIVVDDPGAGYVIAPQVFIKNSRNDPYGCALPASGVGFLAAANGGSIYLNGTACTTDTVSVWGATTGQAFLARWTD